MSQCSRVLDVLRDYKPHSIDEIHERAGTMRLNSRVSDLRKMGFNIAYFRKEGLHTYQLLHSFDGAVRAERGASAEGHDGRSALLGPALLVGPTGPDAHSFSPEQPDGCPAQLPLEAA